jgi:hypothetical protein
MSSSSKSNLEIPAKGLFWAPEWARREPLDLQIESSRKLSKSSVTTVYDPHLP